MHRPPAVVKRASETPLARPVCFDPTKLCCAISRKALIIPTTVPRRPTIGAIAPISARY